MHPFYLLLVAALFGALGSEDCCCEDSEGPRYKQSHMGFDHLVAPKHPDAEVRNVTMDRVLSLQGLGRPLETPEARAAGAWLILSTF